MNVPDLQIRRGSLPLPGLLRAGLRTRLGTLPVLAVLAAGTVALTGCVMDPPGPSPIYSRLPADASGTPANAAHPLTPEERQRYDAIDRQVLAEQDQAIAADAAAQAWARYYTPPVAPVTVYGSYYGGGWGRGWGGGVGYGYGW